MKTLAKLYKKLQATNFRFIFVILALLSTVVLLASYNSNSWFADMYVSFAPYVIVGVFVLSVIAGLLSHTSIEKVLIIIIVVLTLINFIPVYEWLYVKNQNIQTGEVKIASINKLYTNRDIDSLKQATTPEDFDIVGMSEIKKEDYESLKGDWKYSVITDCSCDPALASEIALFSKYPIENMEIISSGKNKGAAVRAEVIIGDDRFVVYVTHPAAPVSSEWFEQRNETLFDLILPRLNSDADNPAIFMGDLNTSPYSKTYKRLSSTIPGYRNIMQGESVYKTWCLAELPLACAPIDHIFITNSLLADSPKVTSIKGSDHQLLSTEIVLR